PETIRPRRPGRPCPPPYGRGSRAAPPASVDGRAGPGGERRRERLHGVPGAGGVDPVRELEVAAIVRGGAEHQEGAGAVRVVTGQADDLRSVREPGGRDRGCGRLHADAGAADAGAADLHPRSHHEPGTAAGAAGRLRSARELNSAAIDSSAPASSRRSRAKQNRSCPSPFLPKSAPGTQPMRPSEIRYSVIFHDSESPLRIDA